MSLKSLDSGFIYKHLNSSNALTNNILSLLNNGITMKQEHIEEALMIIMKNFKYPFKFKIKESLDDGSLVLKYNERGRLPSALPFILTKGSNGGVISVISTDIHGILTNDKTHLKIDPKKLYCLMESAEFAKIIFRNSRNIVNNSTILMYGSDIYSSMFTRVLNKKYSLNINVEKYHKVLFLSSKFFLTNIMGLDDSPTVFNYSIRNCLNGNRLILEELNSMATREHFKDFDTFMKFLTDPNTGIGLKDLTTRSYLEAFITMYDASALLSLESFPYFVYNINSVVLGAYMNNQYSLDPIIGTGGVKIHNEIINNRF